MKRFAACILALSLFIITHAQTYNLTFTACDSNNHYLQLHHVLVINQTQEWSHVIYWPDTTLTMCVGTGIGDIETQDVESLQLFPNNPNPFHGTTTVSLYVPEPGVVNMDVIQIPVHSFLEAFGELDFWLPAQLCFEFGGVDGIAQVVAGTVGDVGDQRQ